MGVVRSVHLAHERGTGLHSMHDLTDPAAHSGSGRA